MIVKKQKKNNNNKRGIKAWFPWKARKQEFHQRVYTIEFFRNNHFLLKYFLTEIMYQN